MKKVAVVTDSVACLNRELAEKYKIAIIPVNLIIRGKAYRDWVDITPSEAYKMFQEDPDSFNTSTPSPVECLEAFRKVSGTSSAILCVTLSTRLSSLYTAAFDARELARTELPGIDIEIMNSESATPSEGMIALAAARAAADGKDLPGVIRAAEEVKSRVKALILLDTIRHVYRSGRIPKIASTLGSALDIKPLLSVAGEVHFKSMVRSRKQGIERMLQMMRDQLGNRPAHIAVTHAYALEEAEKLKERVAAEFDCAELWLSEFSPVMGYACGTGTIGVAFYSDEP
jgi:DegV family protein with EDD domain